MSRLIRATLALAGIVALMSTGAFSPASATESEPSIELIIQLSGCGNTADTPRSISGYAVASAAANDVSVNVNGGGRVMPASANAEATRFDFTDLGSIPTNSQGYAQVTATIGDVIVEDFYNWPACVIVAPEPSDPDGDGVFDDADDCPNDAGPANNAGCPVVEDPTSVPSPLVTQALTTSPDAGSATAVISYTNSSPALHGVVNPSSDVVVLDSSNTSVTAGKSATFSFELACGATRTLAPEVEYDNTDVSPGVNYPVTSLVPVTVNRDCQTEPPSQGELNGYDMGSYESVTFDPSTGTMTIVPKGEFEKPVKLNGGVFENLPMSCVISFLVEDCTPQYLLEQKEVIIDGKSTVTVVLKVPQCGIIQWDLGKKLFPQILNGLLNGFMFGGIIDLGKCEEPPTSPNPEGFVISPLPADCFTDRASAFVEYLGEGEVVGALQRDENGTWVTVDSKEDLASGPVFLDGDVQEYDNTLKYRVIASFADDSTGVVVLTEFTSSRPSEIGCIDEPPVLPEDEWVVATSGCGLVVFTNRTSESILVGYGDIAELTLDGFVLLESGQSVTVTTVRSALDYEAYGLETGSFAGAGQAMVKQDCEVPPSPPIEPKPPVYNPPHNQPPVLGAPVRNVTMTQDELALTGGNGVLVVTLIAAGLLLVGVVLLYLRRSMVQGPRHLAG